MLQIGLSSVYAWQGLKTWCAAKWLTIFMSVCSFEGRLHAIAKVVLCRPLHRSRPSELVIHRLNSLCQLQQSIVRAIPHNETQVWCFQCMWF